jgi:hypothetical protein
VQFDNEPNNHGDHLGSAYQTGWYGYSLKDLRQVLRRKVRGPFSRTFCGAGDLARCREALRSSLRTALAAWRAPGGIYQDALCSRQGKAGDQWCFDAVNFRATGAVTQPLIHWINRPTWQQVIEVQGHRGRSPQPEPGGNPPAGQGGGGQAGVQSRAATSCRKKANRKHRSAAAAKKKKRSCGKRKKKRR